MKPAASRRAILFYIRGDLKAYDTRLSPYLNRVEALVLRHTQIIQKARDFGSLDKPCSKRSPRSVPRREIAMMTGDEHEQAEATAPPQVAVAPGKKHTFACVRCSDRKVKCDRQDPCNACVRHNAPCIFRQPKPPRRRRAAFKDEPADVLKRYEALLRANGIDPDQHVDLHDSADGESAQHGSAKGDSPSVLANRTIQEAVSSSKIAPTSRPAESRQAFWPQILQDQSGRTKFVDNSLWNRIAQEIRDGGENLDEDASDSEEESPEDNEVLQQDFVSVFSHSSPIAAPIHPDPDTIRRLWKIYETNVNPQFKFLHVPTFEQALEKAIANLDRIPRGFEALLFSIYSTAVLSMPPEDCKEEFGVSHGSLLHKYVTATQNALLRAKFMSTTSLVVVQALLHHLISVRTTYEPRAVWNFTGLVLRIAEGMGMRMDGTRLGLPPFETEMRRRMWWQLSVHDFRCAEMCGQAKFRSADVDLGQPEIPTNCDDSDLHPAMTSMPILRTDCATEMLWVMFRTELSGFARGQVARMKKAGIPNDVSPEEFLIMDDLEHKDRLVEQVKDLMETKYLRYCDPTQPLHLFTLLATRAALKLMRFTCHHPRRWAYLTNVPEEEKELCWDLGISVLDYYITMQTNPTLRCFRWNVSYFIQWHIVIHTLDTLRATPARKDADKAWTSIHAIYEHNSHLLLNTNRPVFMAIGNLCLKAVEAKESACEKEGRKKPVWPGYVDKLRQQREAARKRRDVVLAERRRAGMAGLDINRSPEMGVEQARHQDVQVDERGAQYQAHHKEAGNGLVSTTYGSAAAATHQSNSGSIPSWSGTNAYSMPSTSTTTSQMYQDPQQIPYQSIPNAYSTNQFYFQDPSIPYTSTNQTYTDLLDTDLKMTEATIFPTMMTGGYDFDSDMMLAQGSSLDTPGGGVVDWTRWDEFFGGGGWKAGGPNAGRAVGMESGGAGDGGDGIDRRGLR